MFTQTSRRDAPIKQFATALRLRHEQVVANARLQVAWLNSQHDSDAGGLKPQEVTPQEIAFFRDGEKLRFDMHMDALDEITRKYKLMPSARSMIRRLMPTKDLGAIETLPGYDIWMDLEGDPDTEAILFASPYLDAQYYLQTHQGPSDEVRELVNDGMRRYQDRWNVHLFPTGVLSTPSQVQMNPQFIYSISRSRFTFHDYHTCPTQTCELTGVDATDRFPNWYICDGCMPFLQYWSDWLPTALMAINGDFAETEEPHEPILFTEQELRKVRRPNSGKYITRTVTHTYQVITFDMSVKKRAAPNEPRNEQYEPTSPTWLEQAIADDAILYVSKRISQFQRTFRHERYVNMRGKTIDVRSHEKRIPMSVKKLQQTIHKAVASKL